jgi:serine/threonine protein kinase
MEAGVLAYSAPERVSGEPVDARSDVFSAGAWFYELLTGQAPFGEPDDGLKDRICHRREVPPSEVNAKIDAVFDSVCARALAKAPAERYSSAREFADQLRRAFAESSGTPPKDLLSNDVVVSIFLSTLRGGVRTSRRTEQSPPPPARHEASEGQSTNTVWSDQTLRTIEKQLARYIGPVARVVVKNATARSKNVEDLYKIVAESLGSDQERRAFLEGHVSDPAVLAPPVPQPGSEDPTLGNHELARSRSPVEELKTKHVAQPLPVPSAPVPVASARVESKEAKPKPGADPKPSSAEHDSQVIARLEELLGKQPDSLAGYLAEEPPELDRVIYGFVSVTEALSALYASGGKTGGLAPQSIRFDRLGKASIQSASPSTNLQGATSFGSMGSPRYAAPEMFKESSAGANAPACSDVYALGFMFYEILLGRKLFKATLSGQRSDLEWLRWHSDGKTKAPTLKSLQPSRPAALSDLLQSMMEKEPEKRASDLAEIVARLRAIAQQSSRTVVARKVPAAGDIQTSQKSHSPKKLWIIALTTLVVLLLIGTLVWQVPELRQMISPAHQQPVDGPDQK